MKAFRPQTTTEVENITNSEDDTGATRPQVARPQRKLHVTADNGGKQKPLYTSNSALVALGLAICAGLIAIYSWRVHLRFQREGWAQEEIPVSEFRMVLTQVREGMRGTAVVYQAAAQVSYVAGGRHYSPWLPILQPSGSKQFLQLEIINLKKKPCRVHWDQKQPDHAFLTCDGAIQLP